MCHSYWSGVAECHASVLRHSSLLSKMHPHAQFSVLLSWRRRCRGWARNDGYWSRLVKFKSVTGRIIPRDSCRPVLWVKCCIRCCVWCLLAFNDTMLLQFIGGVEIGDRSDSSGDWGLYFLSGCIIDMIINTLNRFGGKLYLLRLGGTISCWFPNTYAIVGSRESDSNITICGSGEATEEIVMVSRASAPDSCVELRTAVVLFRAGIIFPDERST